MRKISLSLLMLGATVSVPALAQNAKGTPQRSSATPPGLAKLLLKPTRGILRALVATQGSNSRLQDRPVSP